MPGIFTKTSCSKSTPFWYSASLQKVYSSSKQIPKNVKDAVFWSSSLEFKTYQKIRQVFNESEITRQYEISILPEVKPYFKKWSWKIDFRVDSNKLIEPLYIESKGKWIKYDKSAERDFVHMLHVIHGFYPSIFSNLILVSESSMQLMNNGISAIPLNTLIDVLKKKRKWCNG